MTIERDLIDKLTTLNQIAEALNRAVDVRGVLSDALAQLVKLMDLETGWIFLYEDAGRSGRRDGSCVLAAHHNLPPALDVNGEHDWGSGCICRGLCCEGSLTEAYNEIHCSRLQSSVGDRRGLAIHASTPLRSGGKILGILNVAAQEWGSFSPEALALLTNAGNLMGVALERARLFDLVQEQRLLEQATLLDFSNHLLGRPDLNELMGYLVGEVAAILKADACALLLPTDGGKVLQFEAATGWNSDPATEGRQVPAAGYSGPGQVMHTQEPLQAEDIEAHDPAPWICDWVQAEGFRGHAVVPLITEGRSVGTLVVNSREPRRLDEIEMRSLRLMANQAALAIEKARLHDQEVKSQVMEKELEVGRQIQLSLLPENLPSVAGWEFAAHYSAAHQVGGDFYDYFGQDDTPEQLGLVIGDVTGKGVPAALFMAHSRTVIRASTRNGHSPSGALQRANRLIVEESQGDLFLTAFYGMLDTHDGRLVYTNAGHNRPLLLSEGGGQCRELGTHGILMGAFGEIDLDEREVTVRPGDLLVLYTDGVTEAIDAQQKMFGEERLQTVVTAQARAGADAEQVVEAIKEAVEGFCGNVPQSDDMTLFVVRRCPAVV